jgi:hypothetical protein
MEVFQGIEYHDSFFILFPRGGPRLPSIEIHDILPWKRTKIDGISSHQEVMARVPRLPVEAAGRNSQAFFNKVGRKFDQACTVIDNTSIFLKEG